MNFKNIFSEKCPKVFFSAKNFLSVTMIKSGQFHIDPESLSPWVKWGSKVVQSVNDPSHNLLIIDQATVDGSMR